MSWYESVNIDINEDNTTRRHRWLHDKFEEANEITILSTSLLSFVDGSNAR